MIHRALFPMFAVTALALAQDARAQEELRRPTLTIGYELDGERMSIAVEGDEVHVTADGNDLGEDRVVRHDGWVEIRDRDGVPVAGAHHDAGGVRLEFFAQARSAWLGVDLTPVEEALANHLGLDREKVALVAAVAENSPAAQAGIHQHDIIVRLDGEERATLERLREVLAEKKPGDVLKIALLRRGESQEVEARLQRARPGEGLWRGLVNSGWQQWEKPDVAWQVDPALRQFAQTKKFLNDGKAYELTWPMVLDGQKAWSIQGLYGALGRKAEEKNADAKPEGNGDDSTRAQLDELQKKIDSLQETLRKLVEQRRKD